MEVVANNYHPGDQRLVDKIVYELKAQGIFDQLRKECFADVDTKPAYQNLRQRVEGSVAGFLKEQSWRPDMNKNQVREMLRKTITESGYLETGVERIVDQVVNPKINTVVLPKVEEVVYNYLGIKKPNRNDYKSEPCDLLPQDLEAVSPESEPVDKKDDKSTDTFQDLDESKTEDESPPFEPLEEQSVYVPHEENSVDSHLSGFSGLVSHESNQSNEKTTVIPMEQDSQMSRNSSDSRLSIVTSDENSKMEVSEDRQKPDDKTKPKSDKHRSRSDKDRSKDSHSRHSTSKDSKSRDRKSSSSKDKPKTSSKHGSHSSNSSTSSSKDKNGKERRDSSRSEKDKKQKDSRSDKSKTREKSSSHKHSHSDKHRKDKDRKKDRPKDDHYSSKDKKNDRRSTDRDSNDGQSSSRAPENPGSQTQRQQEASTGGGDSGNSNHSDNTTKAPVNITTDVQDSEVSISPPESQKLKVFKPKCASNMQEALRLRKIRKQLAKLEKKNQLSLTSVNLDSPILLSASINLDDLNQNRIDDLKVKQENNKIVSELEVVPTPLPNTVISQDNWDAMEAKLRAEVCSEFNDTLDEEETCKFFDSVDVDKIEFLKIVGAFIKAFEKQKESRKAKPVKRKIDHDYKNNNKLLRVVPDKKVKAKKNKANHHDLSEKFPLPLSPAESEKSVGKKEEHVVPLKAKRNSILSNQRYSSDDLYKPRPTFASSRRRGAKNLEN